MCIHLVGLECRLIHLGRGCSWCRDFRFRNARPKIFDWSVKLSHHNRMYTVLQHLCYRSLRFDKQLSMVHLLSKDSPPHSVDRKIPPSKCKSKHHQLQRYKYHHSNKESDLDCKDFHSRSGRPRIFLRKKLLVHR